MAISSEASSAGSFASEFEKFVGEHLDNLKAGSIVTGTVTSVGKEVVHVDINFKSSGVIPVSQFTDLDGKINVAVGERVEVFIVALENEKEQVVLSRERAVQKQVWDRIENIFAEDKIVVGRVVQKVKGGLQVDIGIPAFLPGSQIDVRPHRNLDKFIGEDFEFKVLKITRDKGNIVLSRRAVLMSEREELRSATLEVLEEGVVMEGTVKNITEYGAFIDLGGIDGLLHITDMSWGRVGHPSEKLSVGEPIQVVILKYDQERQRVSLGMKQLLEDPWKTVAERYPVGGEVEGTVVNLTDYGAFIALEDGVEGLVHVSDMSWTKKVRNPSKIVSEGEKVVAVVLGIDTEQQRIHLGLKQLTPNPWHTLHERHPIGSKVSGKVRSIMDFGIFVGVEDGIDGLVHVSDFSWTRKIKDPKEIHDIFKKGDDVEALVLDIDVENERLSLGVKQLLEDPWETIAQRYPVGSRVQGSVTSLADFGVFVEIEEGIEGLIHNSQLDLPKGQEASEVYKPGEQLESEVTNIDREERRISLSVKAIRNKEDADTLSTFTEESTAVTFGDILREKMTQSDD